VKSIRTIALVHDASTPEEVEAKGHELIAEGHATLARARRMQKSPRADLNGRTNRPPGSLRSYNATCKRISGAYRQGNIWICPVDAWEAYHRELAATAPPAEERGELDSYDAACRRGAR